MFGPDRCGGEPKVHFIFNHVNPLTGAIEEKHLDPGAVGKADRQTHLYTLIVNPDNTYKVMVDRRLQREGSLFSGFKPPVNPPHEIDDPTDEKPVDWVDDETIPDPTAVKPADWVDQAEIPDPSATKPEDWDDEADGDWEPPTIRNPEYKGEWEVPRIPNPEYKGVWKPRQMPNPDFYEDKEPHKFQKIAGIGFELWTINDMLSFDNILVTNDESEAEAWAEAWTVKSLEEYRISSSNDVSEGYRKYIDQAVVYINKNPLVAGVGASVVGIALLGILLSLCLRGGSKVTVDASKKKEDDSKSSSDSEEEEEPKKTKVEIRQRKPAKE